MLRPTILVACLGLAVCLVVASAAPARAEEATGEGKDSAAAPAVGPVCVRPFKPMQVSPVRLRQRHPPVWFRSPFAGPAAADADMDRYVAPTAGLAMAEWFLFAGRVLAFPIEMVVCPPWQTRPLEP